ncbi:TPA: phosphopantetheine-binding protein [Providencia alcalifaciens]|uniref:phosphopantetheine-binding protein n=1 Tax=Providencia alcalifaciens TaxID=126385 RepID=UPI001CC7E326|nr:phosphopantetheine-binding protein [Providencia alcalifaciens]CAG9435457.1 Acyl carrier protein [Providencia alcalifaciens]
MRDKIENEVRDVISSCIINNDITIELNTHLIEDLYADSLDLIDIYTALSDKYNLDMEVFDVTAIDTFGDVCNIIEKNINR